MNKRNFLQSLTATFLLCFPARAIELFDSPPARPSEVQWGDYWLKNVAYEDPRIRVRFELATLCDEEPNLMYLRSRIWTALNDLKNDRVISQFFVTLHREDLSFTAFVKWYDLTSIMRYNFLNVEKGHELPLTVTPDPEWNPWNELNDIVIPEKISG